MLVQADKEGGFVVMPQGLYNEKAISTIDKYFRPAKRSAVRVKSKFAAFCRKVGLPTLASTLASSKSINLNVFFFRENPQSGHTFQNHR